ncbi:hypothetical protein DVS28_b0442 (plasmid) [Euzebya pacifica]|uniref:Uncharacterized protein n=1 Tax=Euzebya pacifica TaxID=1608957 RepID=A0A346Y6T5_9ACTN|nr:hypothetical protein DVS28_b0442 [Euzebya pacifica]
MAFLGGSHAERIPVADDLLRAAGAAVASTEDGWPVDHAPVVTVIADGDGWRLVVLRGRTDAAACLVRPDPNLKVPATGPAVIGTAFHAEDPEELLVAVALARGGRIARAEGLPGATRSAVRVHDLSPGPGPTLADGWPPPGTAAVFCDRIVADAGPVALLALADGHLDDDHAEGLLLDLAAAVRRRSVVDPAGFAGLLTACAEEAVTMDDWGPIGGADRYGWSAADWETGLSLSAVWPAVLLDAVDRANTDPLTGGPQPRRLGPPRPGRPALS